MGKFTEFKLPLKELAEGKHEFEYRLTQKFFTDMENTDVHGADICVKLTVNNKNGLYDLTFTMQGEVILLCDRCLDDLNLPIDTNYHVMVQYGDDYNDDTDDLLIIPYSDNTLNVSYMIYDTIVLAIPMKHVHPMGKCNRQMSALLRKHRARSNDEDSELEDELMDEIDNMGSQQPSDPRWDALKGLGSEE